MTDTPQHYFADEPAAPSARRLITADLPGLTLELETDAGVFSGAQLDKGTRILLERAPLAPQRGALLDLGCGYGPIALTLASRSPQAKVWAVDPNNRALGLVRDNAARAGLANVTAARPDEVPADLRFDRIYSNPPIRIGKAALHELLLFWLPRLVAGGSAYLVVQRNLGSDSLAAWLNEEGFPTERFTSQLGFRILRARPRPAGSAWAAAQPATSGSRPARRLAAKPAPARATEPASTPDPAPETDRG
ncbi:MAG TPA: methyltransferase [Actinocrinis sp.]|nr:methyltransferase [Actinocrinis sp.]